MKGLGTLTWCLLGVLIVAIAYFALSGPVMPGGWPSLGALGFSTLSMGQFNMQSSDAYISGQVWGMYVSQDNLGQSAVGKVYPAQMSDNGGQNNAKGFTLELASGEQRCAYPITHDTNSYEVQTLASKYYACDFFGCPSTESARTDCNMYGNPVMIVGRQTGVGFEKWCIYAVRTYDTGTIPENAEYQFSTDFKLTIDGETPITATISNTDQRTVVLSKPDGTKIARGTWAGNLLTGDNCPSPSAQSVVPYWDGTGWRFGDKTSYSYYASYVATRTQSWADTQSWDSSLVNTVVNEWNLKANAALQTKVFSSKGGTSATTSGGISDGRITIDIQNQIQIPTFMFYIKASELGVNQPTGAIQILDAQGTTFNTGQDGIITVSYKNTGAGAGSPFVSAQCDSPVSAGIGKEQPSLAPGYTQTAYVPIEGQASSVTNTQCTVRVCILENCDTRAVQVTVKPLCVCTAGLKQCRDNNIVQCRQDCGGWDVLENCVSQQKACVLDVATGQLACKASAYCNGNNVCEPNLGETAANCGDCSPVCLGEGSWCDLQPCCENLVCKGGLLDVVGKICQKQEPNWTWLWIVILAALIGAIGYKLGGSAGATIGAVIGLILGWAVYWFMNLPAWTQILIGIGGIAGAGLLIYVMLSCGGLLAIVTLYVAYRDR